MFQNPELSTKKPPDKVWEDVVHTLKITGKINSYDLRIIRGFCGSNEYETLILIEIGRASCRERV